ncbi:MAG: C4-dicarboxylate transporter DctA [Verrucomicrobia bacterium]|nr:C4-dicarboxylate transporter DctA [Verrucomicrobiota bacterium]
MHPEPPAGAPGAPKKRDYLYLQVIVGIVAGVLVGWLQPKWGMAVEPLGTGFIKLIKMLIAPIIFTTVVAGIAGMGDLKRLGRVGMKALIYFEIVTTIALIIGLVVGNVFAPGEGMHVKPESLDTKSIAAYVKQGETQSTVAFLMNIVPKTFVGAFAEGEILQVLLLALLFGAALARLGGRAQPVINLINEVARVIFGIVWIVTRLAPLGAFGAMGFTIGKYGLGALVSLGKLLATVYVTCGLFIVLVLGVIAYASGFNFWKVLRYVKEEILIAVGTSSSEAALPGLMDKMEKIGCAKPVVGVVVPAGYSFNLDGTCIYLTCAALFVAQATDTALPLAQQIGLLVVMLLTSKGAAGITGSGFIVLAATLETTGKIPVAGLAIIFGIDRFMSEIRTLTNFIGNTIGTLVIAKWDGALDEAKAAEILRKRNQA